jgi:hypothetical protein
MWNEKRKLWVQEFFFFFFFFFFWNIVFYRCEFHKPDDLDTISNMLVSFIHFILAYKMLRNCILECYWFFLLKLLDKMNAPSTGMESMTFHHPYLHSAVREFTYRYVTSLPPSLPTLSSEGVHLQVGHIPSTTPTYTQQWGSSPTGTSQPFHHPYLHSAVREFTYR